MRTRLAFIAILTVSWALFVAAVYLPDVGRGFVKDDFGWIEAGRAVLDSPAQALLPQTPGFYRPAVTLTFAADYLLHDGRPRGYGFTNLALYLLCIGAIAALCRAMGLSAAASMLGAFVWSVNPHGINMALVWISGRTSLCLTLFAVLAATAVLRQRYGWTAIWVAFALASKEEAVALPVILLAWDWALVARDEVAPRHGLIWRALAAVAVPAALYFAVRAQTGAFTPASAPSYYQLSFAPAFVARNLFEYADRAATVGAIALLIAAAVYRRMPAIDRSRLPLMAACAVWSVGGYALTLFLPIRSSLYAVFPSVGVAIAVAAIVDDMRSRAMLPSRQALRLAVAFGAIVVAMVPAYRARNGRYVEPARLSERALRTIDSDVAAAPAGSVIVLRDVNDPTSSFVGAFGTFATNAVRLRSGRDVQAWIDPPPDDWRLAGLQPPRPREVALTFAVERGRIFKDAP
jgi:hypothetical protein